VAEESIQNLIMSAEEYAQREHETPYLFELEKGPKFLFYFGSPHIKDPRSLIFSQIQSAFEKAKPDLVLVEGVNARDNREAVNEKAKSVSQDEAIEMAGESGFTLRLAITNKIDWDSPEPSNKTLYSYLLEQGFARENIFAWEVMQMLSQYQRHLKRGGFKEFIAPYIERFKKQTGWLDFNYAYDQALKIAEGIIGRKIEVETETNSPDFTDPTPWPDRKDRQTVLNKISVAESLLRDRFMIEEIIKALERYNRLFIVYGASHAVMQEPALRSWFARADF